MREREREASLGTSMPIYGQDMFFKSYLCMHKLYVYIWTRVREHTCVCVCVCIRMECLHIGWSSSVLSNVDQCTHVSDE